MYILNVVYNYIKYIRHIFFYHISIPYGMVSCNKCYMVHSYFKEIQNIT